MRQSSACGAIEHVTAWTTTVSVFVLHCRPIAHSLPTHLSTSFPSLQLLACCLVFAAGLSFYTRQWDFIAPKVVRVAD
ncbi:hypothetical protein V1527DRAFT_174518 [Lipomyces starkeyi]